MTISLSNVAVQQFRDTFTHVYQGMLKLSNTTTTVRGVVGDAYKWPVLGSAVMIERGAPQSLIPASDVTHEQITTIFKNYVLKLPTDIFQQAEVNANEQAALVKTYTDALGRQEDQTLIDELDTAAGTQFIADGGTNLTLDKLIEASELLNEQNVPSTDRTMVVGSSQLASLLEDPTITSTDYNSVRALVAGEINTFMGFNFIVIGTRAEGGLPKTGDIRSVFAYHAGSTGMVFGKIPSVSNPGVHMFFDDDRMSFSGTAVLRVGSSVILPEGVVKINCDETA